MYTTFIVDLKGEGTLMVSNPQLINPFNKIKLAQNEITSIRSNKRTEAENNELLRLSWEGALYYDNKLGPYLPTSHIRRTLLEAARITRDGKTIERGLINVVNPGKGPIDRLPLKYRGPRTVDEMWADGTSQFVDLRPGGARGAKIMLCRPIFPDWKVTASVMFDPEILNPSSLKGFFEKAGRLLGVGTYRLQYGRFTHEITEEIKEAA